jgi:BASS family bile acid:Na+ symporter
MFELLETVFALSLVVFVVGSMAAMGLSLTIKMIIDPLRNVKLVLLALLGNFVLVPIVAFVIILILPLDEPLVIGLICLATAAGAPFLPKLAEVGKGNKGFSVGLMVLLMLVTIIYVPIVLPLMLQDVEVNPWEIAQSLIVLMLIPLAIALFIKARYEDTAAHLQPIFAQASNLALLALIVLGVVLNFQAMIGLVGSWGILAGIIFVLASLVIGLLLGGSDSGIRTVMGVGTGQRNVSAAMVVAGGFGAEVITYVIVVALIMLVLLMPLAGELGKRAQGKGDGEEGEPAEAPAEPAA